MGRQLSIGLVSGADEIRLRSYVNHTVYARLHGLDYRVECGLDEGITNKFFYKTRIVERLLPNYDWLVWIDDDAYITDFERDGFRDLIAAAEAAGKFMVIAEGPLEPNGFWSTLNTGVFALRHDPRSRELLGSIGDHNLELAKNWWDPAEHGIFTAGDQDIVTWYLYSTGLIDQVDVVGHRELNSRGHYYEHSLSDAFVMHFCGYPDKEWGVARFAKEWGIGQELVPDELLDKFSVKVRSPLGPVSYAVRNRKVVATSGLKARLRPYYRKYQAWRARNDR
ncbi:glycosyltransferase family protein [Aestuariimicrobium ganziense]|uniref:hypothetical protein n=1 Tax=Aestuariimicrobium ganziense TaxID=2773677 RepID=UPI0019429949|nr:hypothetical protein [Aestuariimicrobium ganziense]